MSDRAERVYGMRFHGGPIKGPLSHPKGHEKDGRDSKGISSKDEEEIRKAITELKTGIREASQEILLH